MEGNEIGSSRFRVAEWEIDPSTNRMVRGGDEVRVEPKVMDVLVYLASRPGQTVSRQELEGAVWTGTIVSYDAVTGAIQKLRKVFDDEAARLFELQDRITHRIVAALAGRINVQDRQELGRPRTKNLPAYDYFLYGRQRFFLYANAEENRNARESFERAIALDPDFSLAYAMLAWTHAFDAMNGWSGSRQQSLERARELASKAIDLDEAMPVAYFVRGLAYRELGDRVHALVEAEKAIEQDPNYAGAHVLLATLLYFNGRPQEGLDLMNKAVALNPNHPYNYSFHLGQAFYILGRHRRRVSSDQPPTTRPTRPALTLTGPAGQRSARRSE